MAQSVESAAATASAGADAIAATGTAAAGTEAGAGTRTCCLQPGHSAATPTNSSGATSSFWQFGHWNENSPGTLNQPAFFWKVNIVLPIVIWSPWRSRA